MDLSLRLKYIKLYETYSNLLTEKQSIYFEAYYFDDLSLSEIAEKYQVSRNAVHDQIGKTINSLEDYEKKLHVLAKKEALYGLLEKLEGELAMELTNILEGE